VVNRHRSSLYRRWVLAVTAGEMLGFGGIPVAGGALVFWLTLGLDDGVRAIVFYAITVIGGLGEGMVLGWFQQRVLRQVVEGLDGNRWILFTSLAASAAWALGMLAPTLDEVFGLSALGTVLIWVPASVLILLSIGSAQSWVLGGLVRNPRQWIWANALGWLLGLPWTFVLPALLPDTAAVPVWAGVFVVAGILMGITVGLVTGRVVLRIQCETSHAVKGGPSQGPRLRAGT
jgi:hypothetical protein